MTEAKWLACADPYGMLEFVKRMSTNRQSRLFACACCRRVWPLLDQSPFREAVAREGPLILGGEKLIRLEEAVALVWGKSAAAKPESRRAHAGILELFATQGLNGVILETTMKLKKWHTSREAVERFMLRAFGRRPEHDPQPAPAERPSERPARRRAAS